MHQVQNPAAAPLCNHQHWTDARGAALTLRPVQPQDAAGLALLLERGLSRESSYRRFHGALGRLTATRLAQMTQADFERHVCFVVSCEIDGAEQLIAEGRYHLTPREGGAEFALAVADDWQRRGIGRRLMQALVAAARERRVDRLRGEVLAGNEAMAGLMGACGFLVGDHPEDAALLQATRALPAAPRPRPGSSWSRLVQRCTQRLLAARLALGLGIAAAR